MASWFEWLTKERCLWHAEPVFDRDGAGHAMFRCPRCMETWPILSDSRPRSAFPASLPFEAAAVRARRRVVHRPAAGVLASGR
jgi:hypothetical protein